MHWVIVYSHRFMDSSTIQTNSPTFRICTCSFDHLISGSIVEDNHASVFSKSCRHMLEPLWRFFFSYGYLSLDHTNGALAFFCPNRKRVVVSAVKSSESSLTAVTNLALRVCSTRHIIVLKTSTVNLRLLKIARMNFFATLNHSFPGYTKVWCSGRVKLPNYLFLCPVNLSLVTFVQECFQCLGCSNKICVVIADGSHVLQWVI